jgi:hypothetical protein
VNVRVAIGLLLRLTSIKAGSDIGVSLRLSHGSSPITIVLAKLNLFLGITDGKEDFLIFNLAAHWYNHANANHAPCKCKLCKLCKLCNLQTTQTMQTRKLQPSYVTRFNFLEGRAVAEFCRDKPESQQRLDRTPQTLPA